MERSLIRNPVPTPEEMADVLGVSHDRVDALRAIMRTKTSSAGAASSLHRSTKGAVLFKSDKAKRGKAAAR